MEELLSLKWNNHRTTFLHILAVLRDKQLYTDATLACDGKIYPVHKLVLSTCSDYFSAMLDRTSCKNPIIVLKDIKSEDLEALLDYMYLGEVNVRQSDLSTLIKAAECLRVKGLAVADDEPPPRKSRTGDNQTRRGDTSGSPPAKRKRRSDVDDGRDDVRPSRLENRHTSPVHNSTPSRPKTPSNSHSSSTPTRNNPTNSHNNNTTTNNDSGSSISNSTSNIKPVADSSSVNNANDEVLEPVPYVKVEMEEDEQDGMSGGGGGDGSNALGDNAGDSNTGDIGDNFNLSSEDFKEEDDNDGGDLGSDLPEFLQQATTNYSHSSFAGPSFQTDLPWQSSGDSGGTGSGMGGSFGAASGLSFGSSQQQDGHGSTAGRAKQLQQHQRLQGNRPQPSQHTKTSHYATSRTARPKLEKRYSDSDVVHLDNPFNSSPLDSHKQRQNQRQFGIAASALVNPNCFPSSSNQDEHHLSIEIPDGDLVLSSQQQDRYPPVYCPVCGRGFKGSYGKYNLKKHFLVHQGDKPFKCPQCQYSTIQKAHLKRHLEAIHSVTFELAFGGGSQDSSAVGFGCPSESGDLRTNAPDVAFDLSAECGSAGSRLSTADGDGYGADCTQYSDDAMAMAGDCKPEDDAGAILSRKELY